MAGTEVKHPESTHRQRFAFDIGTNSLGWAVWEIGPAPKAEPRRLVDLGVHIFSDGREQKGFTTLKAARGAERRSGRRFERRARQAKALARALETMGLLPPRAEAFRKGAPQEDPYHLRAQALSAPLSPHDLGRAFLHLAKHRGYKSNRKIGDNREDGKKIADGMTALRATMRETNCRTLGELQARRLDEGKAARFRQDKKTKAYPDGYPSRAMVEEEFGLIRTAQKPHHPDLSKTDWETIRRLIFFQRRLKTPEPGRCRFFPDDHRAPMALPSVQRLRYMETLLNLRLKLRDEPPEAPGRPLTREEMEQAAALMEVDAKPSLAAVRKAIGVGSKGIFSVERPPKPRKDMHGNITACRLRAVLGDRWDALDEAAQDALVEALLTDDALGDEEDAAADAALAGLGWGAEDRAALLDVTLETGYHHFGRRVVGEVLPRLGAGMMVHDALDDAGFTEKEDTKKRTRLPYYGAVLTGYALPVRGSAVAPDEAEHGRIPNDTVHIALNRLRKVFNALCDVYGIPDEVNVETTRELHMGAEARREERRRQEALEKEGREIDERIRLVLGEDGLRKGNRRDLRRRIRLFDRQDGLCLYSKTPLSLTAVLVDGVAEVDHVLPWSKTLDDGMPNVALVLKKENQGKGDRAPWEAFDADKRERILDFARELEGKKQIPKDLVRRLGPDGPKIMEERDWLGRQLGDTGYMAKVARLYLASVLDLSAVRLVPGRATGHARRELRLGKSRDDHRHHALDAAVLGLLPLSFLQRMARASAVGESLPGLLTSQLRFRDDIRDRLEGVITSHRIDRKQWRALDPTTTGTAGQMHNDTNYGRETVSVERDGSGTLRLANKHRRTHHLITHRRDDGATLWKAVKGDSNAYLEVFRKPDGSLGAEIVSTFDASRLHRAPDGRMRPHQPSWVREYKGAKLAMRLFGGDAVATGDGSDRRLWLLRKMSNQKTGPEIILTAIECALEERKTRGKQRKKLSGNGLAKSLLRPVRIDVLGRVRDGGPPKGRRKG